MSTYVLRFRLIEVPDDPTQPEIDITDLTLQERDPHRLGVRLGEILSETIKRSGPSVDELLRLPQVGDRVTVTINNPKENEK